MASVARQALEFVDKLQDTSETARAVDVFADYVRFYGFESFAVCSQQSNDPGPHPLALGQTWPKAWCERYLERGYYKQDPIQRYGKSHQHDIFRWCDVLDEIQGKSLSHIIFSEQGYFGLKDGYTIPLVFPNGDFTSIQLGGNTKIDLGKKDKNVLTLASRFLIDILREEAYGVSEQFSDDLTSHEREILLWAAYGKTPWETSEILNLAERTVLCHLESARRKLGAANPTHCVALALSRGIITI